MMACDTTSASACSGKCKTPCRLTPQVWVMALCNGRGTLFTQQEGQVLKHIHEQNPGYADDTVLLASVTQLVKNHQIQHLIMVGDQQDMAAVHAILSPEIGMMVVAEIDYPLASMWDEQPGEFSRLAKSLNQLLA